MNSNPRKKIVLIAGEASGDLLGADLMVALQEKYTDIDFYGVGGERMLEHGLQPFFPMSDINLMGLTEIIFQIPRVFRRLKDAASSIEKIRPDVVITIDAQGFALRLQKRLKKFKIPMVHYVAPTVWAWREHRAKTIAKYIDHLLCLYPFEPPYFTKEGLRATFVGHPITQLGIEKADPKAIRKKLDIPASKTIVSILLGSRRFEIEGLAPLFKETAEKLFVDNKNLHFIVPTLPHRRALVERMLEGWQVPFDIVESTEDKYNALRASTFAMAASGTIALELAAAETPMLIAYKANPVTAFIIRRLVKTPYACMVNILNKTPAVPECLQENCTVERMWAEADRLLKDEAACEEQRTYLRLAIQSLTPKGKSPSKQAAEIIGTMIK